MPSVPLTDWNIMIRRTGEAHFKAIWDDGVTEASARIYFREAITMEYFKNTELQLVKDYACHRVRVEVPVLGGTVTDSRVVIDGWKAVDSNVI